MEQDRLSPPNWSAKAVAAREAFGTYNLRPHVQPAYEAHKKAHDWLKIYYLYTNGLERLRTMTDERAKEGLNKRLRNLLIQLKELDEEVNTFIRLESIQQKLHCADQVTQRVAYPEKEQETVTIREIEKQDPVTIRDLKEQEREKPMSRQERRSNKRSMEKQLNKSFAGLTVLDVKSQGHRPRTHGIRSPDRAPHSQFNHSQCRVQHAGDAREPEQEPKLGGQHGEGHAVQPDVDVDSDMLADPIPPYNDCVQMGQSEPGLGKDPPARDRDAHDAAIGDMELV